VEIIGERALELLVEVNREQSDAYGIDLQEISQAIRATNVSIPGGTLRGETQSFLIRTNENIGAVDEMRNLIVRNQNGDVIYLDDIATVSEAYDRDGILFRYNGEPAIALTVNKIAKGDSVRIVNSTKAIVEEYRASAFFAASGLELDYFSDTSVNVTRNIGVLGRNMIFGFVLVIAVLYFFLGLRNAFLTAIGIPISFAATFIFMDSLGNTLNSNALFALVLVLGLIVDHAIVIIENCYRYNLEGLSRREAAIKGVNQVIAPVVAATATTVAAFLPLTFLPGIIGRFLSVVPVVACAALTMSTLEALFILPSHYADWGRKGAPLRKETHFVAFREQFKRLLVKIYKHRLITVIVFVAFIVVSVMLFGSVGQDLFVSDEIPLFYIDITMPTGSSLEKTEEVINQFEARLLPRLTQDDDILSISSSAGFLTGDDSEESGNDVGQLTIELLALDEGRERAMDDIIAEFREVTRDVIGAEQIGFRKLEGGPPTSTPIAYRLYGDNFDDLAAVSNAIQERLETFEQLTEIRDNFTEGAPELRVLINKSEANRYGLTVQQIGSYLGAAVDGIPSGTIFTNNQEREVIVTYEYDTITRPEQLLLLKIPTAAGQLIPLSAVASIVNETSLSTIRRYDQRREITIESNATNTENLFLVDNDIREYFTTTLQPQYPNVDLVVGGEFADFANLLSDILIVLSIGIFLIYVILGTQFRSYLQPILIIMTIPFSFLGVILYLIISGTSLSTIVIYAAVALAGIAVNDSIVLISFVNELRAKGKSVYEAVIEATTMRLRPILLTSLTTIFGLLPTAIGLGGRSIVWIPMANTIIFGLLFSTTTTLIIVPCLYGLFLERRSRKGALKKKPA